MLAPASKSFLDFVLRTARVTTMLCSLQRHERGYALPRRTVPDYNLIFCRRGRVTWVLDDTPYPLAKGDLIVVPPGVWHHAFSRTPRVTIGSIHVEMTLPGGRDALELLVPTRVRKVPTGTRLDGYLDSALDEWSRGDEAATMLALESWGRLILHGLLRHDLEEGTLRQRAVEPLVAELLDELERRIGRKTTLADLSAWSGYTPQHLNRQFRKALGVTPLRHLARLRMERAAALLAEGRLTVGAVAKQLGFEDQYYFSRAFKRHHGRSPAHYYVYVDT